MTRMTDANEDNRAELENAQMGLRRSCEDLDLAALRISQAIHRHPDLADLLNPALKLLRASKRRTWKAFKLLSGQWAENWSLKRSGPLHGA